MGSNVKVILICEDSMEGIFTAVYDGWIYAGRGKMVEIRTEMPDNLELFSRYEQIKTNQEKSVKVGRSVRRKLGAEVYENICYAAAAYHQDKGTAIFYVLRQALGAGACKGNIMENMADPYVNLVARLHTKVWHEYHRFLGFIRFRKVGGGVLFSKITPENDVLVMLGPHFADRFPNEQWMIYDDRRHKVLLHRQGGECVLHTGVSLSEDYCGNLEDSEEYETLWRAFCKSITIEERKNPHLQQQLVPQKFQKNMLEFR